MTFKLLIKSKKIDLYNKLIKFTVALYNLKINNVKLKKNITISYKIIFKTFY